MSPSEKSRKRRDRKERRRRRRLQDGQQGQENESGSLEAATRGDDSSNHNSRQSHPQQQHQQREAQHVDLTMSSRKRRRRGSGELRKHKRQKLHRQQQQTSHQDSYLSSQSSSQEPHPKVDQEIKVPRPLLLSSDDEDDLEVPYFQNFSFPGSSQLLLGDASAPNEEPLRAGDVIQYTNAIFVAGQAQGRRITQILQVLDPQQQQSKNDFLLSLSNGECLESDTRVKRIREYVPSSKRLYEHEGIFRPIENFRLIPGKLSGADNRDAMDRQVQQIQAILARGKKEQQQAFQEAFQNNNTHAKKRKANDSLDGSSDSDSDSSDLEDGNENNRLKSSIDNGKQKALGNSTSTIHNTHDNSAGKVDNKTTGKRASIAHRKSASRNGDSHSSDSDSEVEVCERPQELLLSTKPASRKSMQQPGDGTDSNDDSCVEVITKPLSIPSNSITGKFKKQVHHQDNKRHPTTLGTSASKKILETDIPSDSDSDDELLNKSPLSLKTSTKKTAPLSLGTNRSAPDPAKVSSPAKDKSVVDLESSDDDASYSQLDEDPKKNKDVIYTKQGQKQRDTADSNNDTLEKTKSNDGVTRPNFVLGKFQKAEQNKAKPKQSRQLKTNSEGQDSGAQAKDASAREAQPKTNSDGQDSAEQGTEASAPAPQPKTFVRNTVDLTGTSDSSSEEEEEVEERQTRKPSAIRKRSPLGGSPRAESHSNNTVRDRTPDVFDFDENSQEAASSGTAAPVTGMRTTPIRVLSASKQKHGNGRSTSSRKKRTPPSTASTRGSRISSRPSKTASTVQEAAQEPSWTSPKPRSKSPVSKVSSKVSKALESSTDKATREQEEILQEDDVVDMVSSVGTANSSDLELSDTEHERRQSTSELCVVNTSKVRSSTKKKQEKSQSSTRKSSLNVPAYSSSVGLSAHSDGEHEKEEVAGKSIDPSKPPPTIQTKDTKSIKHAHGHGSPSSSSSSDDEEEDDMVIISPNQGKKTVPPKNPLELSQTSLSSSSSKEDEGEVARIVAKHTPSGTLKEKKRSPLTYSGGRQNRSVGSKIKKHSTPTPDSHVATLHNAAPELSLAKDKSNKAKTTIQSSSSGHKSSRNETEEHKENMLQSNASSSMPPPKKARSSNTREPGQRVFVASSKHKNPYSSLSHYPPTNNSQNRGKDDDADWGSAVGNLRRFESSAQSVDGDSITTSSCTQENHTSTQHHYQQTPSRISLLTNNTNTITKKDGSSQSIDDDSDSDDSLHQDTNTSIGKQSAQRTVTNGSKGPSPSNSQKTPRSSSTKKKTKGNAAPNRLSHGGAPRLSFTKVSRGCRI